MRKTSEARKMKGRKQVEDMEERNEKEEEMDKMLEEEEEIR